MKCKQYPVVVLFLVLLSSSRCAAPIAATTPMKSLDGQYDVNLPPEYHFPPNPTPDQVNATCGAMLQCMFNAMCFQSKTVAQQNALVSTYQSQCGPIR